MSKVKKRVKQGKQKLESPFKNYWTKKNYIILTGGIILLLIGYFFMNQGPWDNVLSLTIAPSILLIAYIVIFPLAIYFKKNSKKQDPAD